MTGDIGNVVYRIEERLFSLHVPWGSSLDGQTLGQARIGDVLGVQVVAIDLTTIQPVTGTRYVHPNGTDLNNNCTDLGKAPCKTIQHAVDQAATGDTILVAAGLYTDVHSSGGYTQVGYPR